MLSALIMTVVLVVALGFFAYSCRLRIAILLKAKPEHRWDQIGKRVRHVLVYMFGQKKLFKDFWPGLAHALLFWGFCVLLIRSLDHLLAGYFGHGFSVLGFSAPLHHGYLFLKDVTELVVLLMVGYALYRRLVVKPERLTLSADALTVLAMIGALMLTDFLSEGARFAFAPGGPEQASSPISALTGAALAGLGLGAGNRWAEFVAEMSYWTHVFVLLGFLNYLPYSKHMHVLTILPNVFFDDMRPRPALKRVPDMEAEFEKDDPRIGVSRLEDMTWPQILNVYSCTENGRCSTNCPAQLTDKPLNPKKVMEDLKHHLDDVTLPWLKKKLNPEEMKSVIEVVGEDVIWACTTCGACEENCPIMNHFVQNFVDMRQYLVMMESRFPQELITTFRNLEDRGNPWGLPATDREKWTEGLDVPRFTEREKPPEYLFWVGCAGAFDDRSKKTAQALVEIFNRAGLSYGILGNQESCTGDTARRAGNEYLFQTMAEANIEKLNRLGVKKIVTMCPHCLQTLGNEYPEFGGEYEVVHHSQLLPELIAQGKLRVKSESNGSVVYHDACYLGRYNKIFDQPRELLKMVDAAGLREAAESRENGTCCGAGGGWMWMEEKEPRMNDLRTEQLLKTGAKTMATACPFCKVMITDGVSNKGKSDEVAVRDIAEIVRDSLVTLEN